MTAPDRGPTSLEDERAGYQHGIEDDAPSHSAGVAREYLADQASQPQNFTLRGVLVGLAIGVVICFSNMYFGLQTGWVSSMAMPSALIGFAYFKVVARTLKFPFTPVENVLVQSVAGSVGTMPLGCGFVGVIPALNYLLKTEENGPLDISLWRLIIWSVGICFFGVVFAVPLRREMIIREKLKFPSGTATALLIKVLHGDEKSPDLTVQTRRDTEGEQTGGEEAQGLLQRSRSPREEHELRPSLDYNIRSQEEELGEEGDWKSKIRLLLISFGGSALYTVISYFIPQLHDIPIFGLPLARTWLWTLNPSPAYVGQGIIMGPSTTLHMLLGSIIGWGILSPLAKHKGWAPGPVSDWTNGSKGWIVWISLAIMLADSLINLGWLILRPVLAIGRAYYPSFKQTFQAHTWKQLVTLDISTPQQYAPLNTTTTSSNPFSALKAHLGETSEPDAPPSHLISNRTTLVGLLLSLILCIAAIHISFPNLIPLRLTLLSLLLALLLSIMGVRALGETDLNPVSGISKLTQLIFALVTPTSGPAAKNAVIINLVAGAVSESAALQAGDLLQDLKCGHLLGAAPKAQFYGQIIGSAVGAVVSAVVYKLYTRVYSIPGGLFEVPTAYVWVFTARLVTGDGLPPMVVEWAGGAAVLFALGTVVRVWGTSRKVRGLSAWWIDFVPGGIAVAVGMYNTPSFTLARTIGGLVSLWWRRWKGRSETPIIVLASGLILGEGLFSIVNLLLASLNIPHL